MTEIKRSRFDRILDILESGPATSSYIAKELECPIESVRRTIKTIRSEGYNVAFAKNGEEYVLGPSNYYGE